MARTRISETEDWELESSDQDIRGWTAVDSSGQELGRVTDLVVNDETEMIDGIVLDSGQEYHDTDWDLGDGQVLVGGTTGGAAYATGDAGAGATTTADTTDATSGYATGATSGRDSMRVRRYAEDLRAEKRAVQAGEVEVRKDVVEEQQTIDVPVTREEVQVRRFAVDRPASEAEIVDTGDTIRIPVVAEQVEVDKDVRVAEEVEISKRAVTDTQRVSDTVREERIDIDREGDVAVTGDADLTRRQSR